MIYDKRRRERVGSRELVNWESIQKFQNDDWVDATEEIMSGILVYRIIKYVVVNSKIL